MAPGSRDELRVRWGATEVGRLRATGADRLSFTYAERWLATPEAFPISISLPLRADEYVDGPGHAFFANLLPEGAARTAVCRRLGISEGNDLALLRAIGGECAGALTIVEPDARLPDTEGYRYEALDAARLQSFVSAPDAAPLLAGGPTTRLSLAGAQDKLPVARLDGRLHLPLEGAPSTHILKLPSRSYADLTINEAFVLGLGRHVGLDVVDAELVTDTDPPSLLVQRYDRPASDDPWPVVRLHQEDLCQAMGLPSTRKYEQEGGPTLPAVIELVRAHVRRPLVEVRRLIEWQAFNIISGNSDGHGKNLAILYQGGAIRLAPFYDLLSTRTYATLDRKLAMSVAGRRDPDQIARAQWEELATVLGVGRRLVVQFVRELAEQCNDAMTAWRAEFRERHGDSSIVQTLPRALGHRARRMLRQLAVA